jgi:hypothetical protein
MAEKKFHIRLGRWSLAVKLIPIVIGVIILKLLVHKFNLESITLNPLFTSLLAATTFLLGFLISGVLTDYKEGEKLPGEIASNLSVLNDETSTIFKLKKSEESKEFLKFQLSFIESLNKWLYKKESFKSIMQKIEEMNDYFIKLESQTQVAFISRMKQEQNALRKNVTRIHTIRETGFVGSAYVIAEVLGSVVVIGLVILKMEPFYESLLFVALVTFLIWYMIFLIKDLDDPFEYEAYGESGNEVSLMPIHDYEERFNEQLKSQKII